MTNELAPAPRPSAVPLAESAHKSGPSVVGCGLSLTMEIRPVLSRVREPLTRAFEVGAAGHGVWRKTACWRMDEGQGVVGAGPAVVDAGCSARFSDRAADSRCFAGRGRLALMYLCGERALFGHAWLTWCGGAACWLAVCLTVQSGARCSDAEEDWACDP
jgi:hypothetical protein